MRRDWFASSDSNVMRCGCCTISMAAPPMPHITVGMPGSTHEPFASRFSTSYLATKASVTALPVALSLGSTGMKNGAPSRSCCTMPQTPEKSGWAVAAASGTRPIASASNPRRTPRGSR